MRWMLPPNDSATGSNNVSATPLCTLREMALVQLQRSLSNITTCRVIGYHSRRGGRKPRATGGNMIASSEGKCEWEFLIARDAQHPSYKRLLL